MAVGHLDKALAITTIYFLPRLIGFGRVSLPVRFFAMTPGRNGGITAAGVGAITGIGLSGNAGSFVGMMVGLTFGMPTKMRLLRWNGKRGARTGQPDDWQSTSW
jgi:hypothetical protein